MLENRHEGMLVDVEPSARAEQEFSRIVKVRRVGND